MESLKDRLKSVLKGGYSEELKDKARKRLYKYHEKTGLLEETSFSFEDNLVMLFIKLAKAEGFISERDKSSTITWEAAARKMGRSCAHVERELYDGEKPSIPEVYTGHSPVKGLTVLASIYRDQWSNFLEVENKDPECLLTDVKERVISVFVPSYDRVIASDNILGFVEEAFDLSVEMAVCAYAAYKLGEVDVAWSAFSKAKELLGLYCGVRAEMTTNKAMVTKLNTKKGALTKKRNREFMIACLTKKVLEQAEYQPLINSSYDKRNELINQLVGVFNSVESNHGVKIDRREESVYTIIDSWLDVEGDLKAAFAVFLDKQSGKPKDFVKPVSEGENDEYISVNKEAYERWVSELKMLKAKIEAEKNYSIGSSAEDRCEKGDECPRNIQRKEVELHLENLIINPLY